MPGFLVDIPGCNHSFGNQLCNLFFLVFASESALVGGNLLSRL